MTDWLELAQRLTRPMEFGEYSAWRRHKADQRAGTHRDGLGRAAATTRLWRPDTDIVGVTGEYAFARAFGIPLEVIRSDLGAGDRGIDFRKWLVTIDVKTRSDVRRVLIEGEGAKQPLVADMAVLAHYQGRFPEDRAELIGWLWREEIFRMPVVLDQQGEPRHLALLEDWHDIAELRVWADRQPPG